MATPALTAADVRVDVNLYVPEKHALTEMEPLSAFNPTPKYARITKPWLALILKIVDVLREIAVRTTGAPAVVIVDGTGRLRPAPYTLAAIAFHAADFTALGATWDVAAANLTTWAWARLGPQVTLAWVIEGSTHTGAPFIVAVALPSGVRAARQVRTLCELVDDGTPTVGVAWVQAGDDRLFLARLDQAPLTAGTLAVSGELTFEIEG